MWKTLFKVFLLLVQLSTITMSYDNIIQNVPTKRELYLLRKLLAYRMSSVELGTSTTTLPPSTELTLPSIFTTSTFLPVATLAPLAKDFYSFLERNSTLEQRVKNVFMEALPHLQRVAKNDSGSTADSRQTALLELARQMHPLIAPFIDSSPNMTDKITALGQQFFPEGFNKTGQASFLRGAKGWGGSSCCSCCGGGGWGGGGGGGGGSQDNALLGYLLAKGNSSGSSDILQTLLPLLFGIIALLIMKLPT